MNNVVFTIVAKNYIPLAQTLGWSISKYNTTPIDFYIFVVDELEKTDTYTTDEGYKIVPLSLVNIEGIEDWAFKYNVTEFCTAVKPSCFKYAFDKLGFKKAIYFDPDIFVFNNLDGIFNELDNADIVVTPHYTTPQVNYTGDQPETGTLFVGIYNFGFVAFNNSGLSLSLLNWWENRLSNQCYADIQDALHTDQKWGDFLSVYANTKLLVSQSIGRNLAPWNLFEREIVSKNDRFLVRNRINGFEEDLIFVHFAGFDPNDLALIHKDFWKMPIEKYPDYELVRKIYIEVTSQFNFTKGRLSEYGYSRFSNGIYIQDFYRRLYRSLTEDGKIFTSPFNSDARFYNMLESFGLIVKNKPQKLNSKNAPGFENKITKIQIVLKLLFKVLGAEKYFLLMKFLNRYSRTENQAFLLGEKIKKIY
ncbi:hypothetical protein [Mucilaginibacter terrae]|uniref:Lipopolysaccharide biosynthesis glycosyltransferase n=1 Tax=Mucilaginibacter terrae TaxID=1955052 RepID=A0ABU3GSX5_9SPHI|nr:hypothetical protein [Mucilaginibacter terrae]MDT3401765.1 lipopolysaccharide biosynthesis glycosyltransferase [Mucilaginibacter terrae]